MKKYGVCYYVLGCIEPYLEFIEDDSLEDVIFRVKTNDFTGVRFARTGLDEVPYINICDENGFCLYRLPVTELQHNDFGYVHANYGDDETAEQGEPVDVENTSASEQDNTFETGTCETCKYRNIYFRCDCHSSHLFNHDLKYNYSCIFYVNKNHYDDVFRSGG